MRFVDRLQTIAVTATLTSAAWIVAGSIWFSRVEPAAAPTAAGSPVAAAAPTSPAATSGPAAVGPAGPGEAAGLLIPVQGDTADRLVDSFNEMRGTHRHEAIDIMAPRGTPVLAAAAGTVEKLFLSNAGGNTIYVRSPDRTTIDYYAHLDHYAPGLHESQAVARGQVLGAVGSTGDANPAAPHLHFAIMRTTPQAKWYQPSTPIDPYPLLGGK